MDIYHKCSAKCGYSENYSIVSKMSPVSLRESTRPTDDCVLDLSPLIGDGGNIKNTVS